jgi:hypothetical protein
MYRLKDIQRELATLVGWWQSYDRDAKIDESLTVSDSGVMFQDAHPLVTLKNIESIMPLDYHLRYPEYRDTDTYKPGDKVVHGKDVLTLRPEVWEAITENVGVEPSDGENWKRYNPLSDYLRELNERAITNTVTRFINEKLIAGETKTLLERTNFFDGSGKINNEIDPTGSIVGFEILPVRSMGVTTKIEKIGLQFNKNGRVKLYLMHTSQVEPIKIFDLEYTKGGSYQWFDVGTDVFLPYMSETTSHGGMWYLCYDERELPMGMYAINISKDFSRDPCGTCNIGSVQSWRELTKYIRISPFRVDVSPSEDGLKMWDIQNNMYTSAKCYGINVQVSVSCDITDFIVQSKYMFTHAIVMQMAAYILRELALNPNVRQNANQLNIDREMLLYEVDGNSQGRAQGIGFELKKAFEALSIDTKGMDRICLSCRNNGIRFKAT